MTLRETRRVAATLALPVLLALSANPVAVSAVSLDSMVGPAQPPRPAAQVAPNACADNAYSLLGPKWFGPLKWSFQSSSVPSDMSVSNTLGVIRRSFGNMTAARNDCGLPDTVHATSTYLGSTSAAPGVTKRGFCKAKDGKNVVGFAPLPSGILAVTCTWGSNGHMKETDIRINSNLYWALTVASCHYWQELLEPTMTHEIGHAFGLGHVGERKHGRLTMSTTSDGSCDNHESTLGLGDIRGMTHLYP
jgi:hypothetical protein